MCVFSTCPPTFDLVDPQEVLIDLFLEGLCLWVVLAGSKKKTSYLFYCWLQDIGEFKINSASAIDLFKGLLLCIHLQVKNETANYVASSCQCTIKLCSQKHILNPQCFMQFIVVISLLDEHNLAQI